MSRLLEIQFSWSRASRLLRPGRANFKDFSAWGAFAAPKCVVSEDSLVVSR